MAGYWPPRPFFAFFFDTLMLKQDLDQYPALLISRLVNNTSKVRACVLKDLKEARPHPPTPRRNERKNRL